MNRLFIFPYGKDTLGILRFEKLLREYEKAIPIIPACAGIVGKDANAFDGGDPTHTELLSRIPIDASPNDALFLADPFEYGLETKDYVEVVSEAFEHKMNILTTNRVKDFISSIILDESMITILDGQMDMLPAIDNHKNLIKLDVPVVTVMGSGPYCDKFETQLLLRDSFLKKIIRFPKLGQKNMHLFLECMNILSLCFVIL